jgi:uncharacterized membrane protein YtjA (UPF0391 family)
LRASASSVWQRTLAVGFQVRTRSQRWLRAWSPGVPAAARHRPLRLLSPLCSPPHRRRAREGAACASELQESPMLYYAVVFLVVALIAAVLGFGGIASGAAGIAKVLFLVFIVLAVASFVFGLLRRR